MAIADEVGRDIAASEGWVAFVSLFGPRSGRPALAR
jgi:hypothetical protein